MKSPTGKFKSFVVLFPTLFFFNPFPHRLSNFLLWAGSESCARFYDCGLWLPRLGTFGSTQDATAPDRWDMYEWDVWQSKLSEGIRTKWISERIDGECSFSDVVRREWVNEWSKLRWWWFLNPTRCFTWNGEMSRERERERERRKRELIGKKNFFLALAVLFYFFLQNRKTGKSCFPNRKTDMLYGPENRLKTG